MICPNCGKITKNIQVPVITPKNTKDELGKCKYCKEEVFNIGTQKNDEESLEETVKEGENRQLCLARLYTKRFGGEKLENLGQYADIDYLVKKSSDQPLYYLEVKERSCSINAYRYTKFPYAKISTGKNLINEEELDVYILLKFTDCWSRLQIDPDKDYTKGENSFIPGYRDPSHKTDHQKPVNIHVHNLEVFHIDN